MRIKKYCNQHCQPGNRNEKRRKVRIYYPDLRLPEFGMIIEYFGINGNSSYDECTRHKIKIYKQAGIDGLFLKRDSLRGDWPTKIMVQIETPGMRIS